MGKIIFCKIIHMKKSRAHNCHASTKVANISQKMYMKTNITKGSQFSRTYLNY